MFYIMQKVGQGAFENTHKLEMIQNTELKRSIIGINPNWLSETNTQ